MCHPTECFGGVRLAGCGDNHMQQVLKMMGWSHQYLLVMVSPSIVEVPYQTPWWGLDPLVDGQLCDLYVVYLDNK